MSESPDEEPQEERRRQGIRIKLPGGGEIEIRGLTTIMALLLVLTGVNTWSDWQSMTYLVRLTDAVFEQTRAINLSACMMQEHDPAKSKQQYEQCAWRYMPSSRQKPEGGP